MNAPTETRTVAEEVEQETARLMALPPWERAQAVCAAFDRSESVFSALARRYRVEDPAS